MFCNLETEANMKDKETALIWPRFLQLPRDTVKIVYLDLNHWIYLAQAFVGHPAARSVTSVLDACRAARLAGTAAFVLSSTHYIEMLKIKDPAQRRAIADVMEELTDFAALVSRVVVMELELAAVLDQFATQPNPLPTIPLVGRGGRHTAGINSGLKIMGSSGDETDRARGLMGAQAFDDLVTEANLLLERSALRGPTDDQLDTLRSFGWNPGGVIRIGEQRAAEEQAQRSRLDDETRWRRGRLRDVVAARELFFEFQNILPRRLKERGLVLDDVASDVHSARAFIRAMPSTEVSIALKTAWHRNRDKQWTANDIHDIDAMALSVPYCDIVVTEKACHHALLQARLGNRMHTALLRSLEELPSALDSWIPKRVQN
jgi:hypothetical protein